MRVVLAAWLPSEHGALAQPRLALPIRQTNGWAHVEGITSTNSVVRLEASTNLVAWSVAALLDPRTRNAITGEVESTHSAFAFADRAAARLGRRFYRALVTAIAPTDDWKNQVLFPNDAFSAAQSGAGNQAVRWVKFAVLRDEPDRVFYQDSEKYPLHHDFARARLGPFQGMSREAFDRVSLYVTNQLVLLGTVLFPPRDDLLEYGIQFAGRDPYPAAFVASAFELVRSTVVGAATHAVGFYFPAYEQSDAAAIDETFLAARGIRLSSATRWQRGDRVYSSGWALGRLRFVVAREIDTAYADGRLGPRDILVTDAVPAEVPFVAGIVTWSPATPNSHVAILANGYGVPFVYVGDGANKTRVQRLLDQEIVFQCGLKGGASQIQIVEVDGTLEDSLRAELNALKLPPAASVQPKARLGFWSAATDSLTLADTKFFGGKAANFGLLRRTIPSHCPVAIAFSFDLWEAFLDQVLPSGRTLRAEMGARLAAYTYPPNLAALRRDLTDIRSMMTRTARFDAAQQRAILDALAGFDPARKIRFRSSSNAEDAQSFSAAGLYDSYSGCLADDLDTDNAGPCLCDAAESAERGVFRAIQKVLASFYNENAFLERLRRGLDENQVGMAILVHYSTPDEVELANGVATVRTETPRFGEPSLVARLVTQAGAVSVANPEGNARPEVVELAESGDPILVEGSALVPLGSHVLGWEGDYRELGDLLFRVTRAYRGAEPNPATANRVLDFEYKKVAPGRLLIKQVRELPVPKPATATRYLLNEPTRYWVYQKEGSDVFANHRLKGFLRLENRNTRLDATNLATCFYTNAVLEFRSGDFFGSLSGGLAAWSNATHSLTHDSRRGWVANDSWSVGTDPNRLDFQLTSVIPEGSSPAGPFVPQAEIRKWLRVRYATPQPALDWEGNRTTTTNDEVQLVACPDLATLQAGSEERFGTTSGVNFRVAWLTSTNTPGPPMGIDQNLWGDYPAAYSPWAQTTITGLVSEPIELRGYYSQSAQAGHKYRYAQHLFEPALEPNLPAPLHQALEAANIRWIHVDREVWPGGRVTVTILDRAGQVVKRH